MFKLLPLTIALLSLLEAVFAMPQSAPPMLAAANVQRSAANVQRVGANTPRETYRLPVLGTVSNLLTRAFEVPATRYAAGHRGIDLAAASGTPVVTPAAGVVTFRGQVAGRPLIVIAHADGLRSTLEPVSSDLRVGTAVAGGQAVGSVDTGHDCASVATCLHWGVRTPPGNYLNPLVLLGTATVRLYPP